MLQQKCIKPSIHTVAGKLEPFPVYLKQEFGYTLGRTLNYYRANTDIQLFTPMDNLE